MNFILVVAFAAVINVFPACEAQTGHQYSNETLAKWSALKNLVPLPAKYKYGNTTKAFCDVVYVNFKMPELNQEDAIFILQDATKRFSDEHLKYSVISSTLRGGNEIEDSVTEDEDEDETIQCFEKIDITVSSGSSELSLETEEQYKLKIKNKIILKAKTIYGVVHGLQTLGQLIELEKSEGKAIIMNTPWSINDKPRFKWRGMLLDTSRSFIQLEDIERTLTGMEAVKMNVLHWHITDAQTFPVEMEKYPDLTKGYTPKEVYSKRDISKMVQYAKQRGIRLIPEVDTPAHSTTFSGVTNQYESIMVCNYYEPYNLYCAEPPCGQLNPLVNLTYEVVESIMKEVAAVFPDKHFHVGSDEPNVGCWNTSAQIQDWIVENGYNLSEHDGFIALEKYYNDNRDVIMNSKSVDKIQVAWDDILEKNPSTNTVIQIWHGNPQEIMTNATEEGYSVIMSPYEYYYLDCGTGNFINNEESWCDPYKTWLDVYKFEPTTNQTLTKKQKERILGGEVAVWSEIIDKTNLDPKIWPRAAAAAERFWSPIPDDFYTSNDWQMFALKRLNLLRERFVNNGINAMQLQPKWCLQTDLGFCINPALYED